MLVLERGPHVDPRDFVEDEVAMYLKLYNEGALQVARDFRFQVLQGMCVGGSTVVNNAICFDPPRRCSSAGRRAGLDGAEVERAIDARSAVAARPAGAARGRTTRPARCSPRACERSASRAG